jgi:transposase InsO family protein
VKEEQRMQWAQFRFGVIAPLVCRRLEPEEKQAVRAEILGKAHLGPDGMKRRVAGRTLRRWVALHGAYGFAGLLRAKETHVRQYRAIAPETLALAESLRLEKRTRSIATIISLLKAAKKDVSGIAKSTLNFHLNKRGASKEKHASEKGTFQRFQKDFVNELWQCDTSAGLWLPDPTNPKLAKRTKLISFIDDCSRYVPYAQFYWDEQVPSLIDCFRKALLSCGKPGEVYADNGPVYVSKAMERACSQLGIGYLHAEEYCPEGKGKIERHFGSVKSSFYGEAEHAGLETLEQLNEFFHAWLQIEYHQNEHRDLGVSPLTRWKQDEDKGLVVPVAAESIRRALMVSESRKVNTRTGLVSLNNRTYRVGKELAGKVVEVMWESDKLNPTVEIWHGGRLVELAQEVVPGSNIDYSLRPERKRGPTIPGVFESSKLLRKSLVDEYKSTGKVTPIVGTGAGNGYVSLPELEGIAAKFLVREFDEQEVVFIAQIFSRLSPISAMVVENTFDTVVQAKGNKLHLQYYLDQVELAIKSTRRK